MFRSLTGTASGKSRKPQVQAGILTYVSGRTGRVRMRLRAVLIEAVLWVDPTALLRLAGFLRSIGFLPLAGFLGPMSKSVQRVISGMSRGLPNWKGLGRIWYSFWGQSYLIDFQQFGDRDSRQVLDMRFRQQIIDKD
jgi:hypothetical protein